MSDRAYTNEWLINKKKFSLLCGVYHLLQNLKWLWGLADESHFREKIGIFNWNSTSGGNNSEKSWRKRWNENVCTIGVSIGVSIGGSSSDDVLSEESDSNGQH